MCALLINKMFTTLGTGSAGKPAARGCSATQLKRKELWFNGPPFLTTNLETYKQQTKHVLSTKDPKNGL